MRSSQDPMQAVTETPPPKRRAFGAFWMGGPISAMEQACLNSFLAHGHDLTVFSYDRIPNLPQGATAADAAEIVPREHVNAFLFNGQPDLSHFSDYFRYAMIEMAALCWVDTDIVCLGTGGESFERENVFGREPAGTINGAVLFLGKRAIIQTLRQRVETLMHKDLTWGETGPLLLQCVLKNEKIDAEALEFAALYPIDHNEIGRSFLPEHRDWCESACSRAATLHLFNNVIVRMGYWKMMAPPPGSYLHACLKQSDSLHFFSDVFPESVMRRIVYNFRASQTGTDIGFRAALKEFLPSFRRSFTHHSRRQASQIASGGRLFPRKGKPS